MILAAMQPYFFPYLGQFDLLAQADLWLAYDQAQFIRHGWVNRNRVLHPSTGWQYISVPLKKHPYTIPICEVEISPLYDWREDLFKRLGHYRKEAPYYRQVIAFLEELLAPPEENLSRLNVALFRAVAKLLEISTPIVVFSQMGLGITPEHGPENLAMQLCHAIGADEFINPPGGAALYDPARLASNGIRLRIQSFSNMTYPCGRYPFEPALSILDVLMWNTVEQVRQYLDLSRAKQTGSLGHD